MEYWEADDTFLSRWLNDELSQEEKDRFEASEAGKEFIDLISASEMISPPAYSTEKELGLLKESIQELKAPKGKSVWMLPQTWGAVAAVLILLIVATVLLLDQGTIIKTGYGEQELVTLPDGSEVRLNVNSSIAFDEENWQTERNIRLTGEAFFEVKKGSRFSVETENGSVAVLGTSFNVRSRGQLLDVSCYTGKVGVTKRKVNEVLLPGKSVRLEGEKPIERQDFNVKDKPTWFEGITKLENVPFPIALDELKNVYGLEISYDQSLDSLLCNTAFPHDNLENAIKLVLEPVNVRYTYYDKASLKLVIQGLTE
ncbi:MAG: FecR domain-containing protein [Bacteroidota bacterium]